MTPVELLDLSRDLHRRKQPHAWITVVSVQYPSSAYVGAQAIVEADGSMHGWIGGGCVRGAAREAALRALASSTTQRLRLSNTANSSDAVDVHPMNCASNGEIELFIQPAELSPRLRIYGRTPVAEAAAWLAQRAEFDPLTDADEEGIASDASFALVATQGEGDEAALEDALRSRAQAVLLIASQRKAERLRAAMLSRGISETRLKAVSAPAGPDIGAVTPNEIALSAIAGLIALRRQRTHAPPNSSQSTGYVNPVCGAVVDPARAVSTVTLQGQTHYFCCEGCRTEFDRNPEKYLSIGSHMREPVYGETE
jgi:xanthine dehydrogenase accessory factor